MSRWPKPPEGSWTEHYPKLGTAPVSYEDSISPEFYALEAEAVFKRAWLNVGRVDLLPRNGSYFAKEIEVAKTSVVIVRDMEGTVRAFHNICRHRGNKLVWNDFPKEETAGVCRQFTCKYHGWRYNLDGALNFVQQEGEFFDFDKDDYGLVPVHCDVWEGFIFINLAEKPEQSLTEFLGPMITSLAGYPFDKMTERWYYRSEGREQLEAVHGRVSRVLPRSHPACRTDTTGLVQPGPSGRVRSALLPDRRSPPVGEHLGHPHLGPRGREAQAVGRHHPRRSLWALGQAGPGSGEDAPGLNPGGCEPWGSDSFQLFPNFTILIWAQGWYLTYHYWPTSAGSHLFEGTCTSCRPRLPGSGSPTR